MLASSALAGDLPVLQVQVDQVVAPVSPVFSGMMTEEINHSYDGGLYGELIQNRAFEDEADRAAHWSVFAAAGAAANLALDHNHGLNEQLTTSLRVVVSHASAVSPAGVVNDGYWGIPVRPATDYRASFYAKAAPGFKGSATLAVQSEDGGTIFARAVVGPLEEKWQKYSVALTTSAAITPTNGARFAILLDAPGTVWFDLVSLFPPTWKDRPNGNRIDLMQKLSDMRPRVLRFPGGNYLEGSSIATRFPWRQTLGDLTRRSGHEGCWGYRSSDGLGLLEFLEWAEDVGAEPLLAVYAGYSLPPKNEVIQPGADLAPFVADAMDEIEYVTGDTNTVWGACRAADGHPAPFKLRYVEIGNEDWFDPSGSYDARFTQFYDAIKSKYPQLQCVSTVGNEQPAEKRVHSRTPDLVDEHYYRSAQNFEDDGPTHFDQYDRHGPKIFVGEWAAYEDIVPWLPASRNLPPTPTFKAALGDAAWLTAMERNSDIVLMQCYAPMLVNVNPGGRQWRPNLIGYDALNSYGSPSYYVIKMFNENRGNEVIKATLEPGSFHSLLKLNYSATKDSGNGLVYLKLVNARQQPQPLQIQLDGVGEVRPGGVSKVMKSDNLYDGNSLAEPLKVVPVSIPLTGLGKSFTQILAPYSITIFNIQTR
jgi:alpha-N-arabinofuranosidase